MKRIVLFITAVLLFAGCAKEQLVEERSYTGPVTVVSATFESLSNGATKASVTDAGAFTWQNGDKAAFTVASGSSYLTGTNSSTTATAVFSINGSPSFTSSSFAFYPSDLTTGKSTSSLAVKVPATREWEKEQTNVAMYGAKVENEPSFNFTHMGGLVRIKVNNVPTNARKFVFKTPGYKINGDFTAKNVSNYNVIETETSTIESEQTYTLTWTTAPAEDNTMDFYIPLPVGTYSGGFAFEFLDGDDAEILSKTSSQSETIARKDLVLMPAITLMGGEIEPAEKAAVVQEVPAGHSGDFLLANSEKVLLKVNASEQNKDITLKYNGGDLPTNLEIQVVGGKAFDKKISGVLPKTHVDFKQGEIAEVEMTTSSSTFEIVHPAKISTKLTVKGGNVKVKGAQVAAIEVVQNAVADKETNAPVQIVVVKSGDESPVAPQVGTVTAQADVVVAPAIEVSVKVEAAENVKVANGGAGTVTDKNDGEINDKPAAAIGDIKYFTLADAVKAAPMNATEATTITLLDNVTDGAGIFLAAADKKNIIIDLNEKTYTAKEPAVGSSGTENQAFHLEKGNTVVIKNGTLTTTADSKKKADFRFVIQNYANLTLEGVTVDGSNLGFADKTRYTVSNNCGTVNFTGTTSIKAASVNDVAFDVCKYSDYDAPTVTVNTTGTIEGQVEVTGGNLVVEAGTFKTTGARRTSDANHQSPTLLVTSGNVTVNDGSFTSDHDVAVRAEGGTVTLNNGTFSGVEGAVCFPGAGATINIVDGTYTASDNAVLIGQGSAKDGIGNTVTISGGTFNGGIKSSGYIACGIYAPWKDNITVTGGTFNITNGAGVVARAGVVTIDGGTFKCTGTATGKVGDKAVDHPCECLIFDDSDPNYPGKDANSKIVVNGGTFSDESAIKYAAKKANITIKLQANRTQGTSVFVKPDQKQNITFDLNGHDYVGVGPAVGSTGTSNQLFHIEEGNTFTLKNSVSNQGGTVSIASEKANLFRFIIQNYADLTLENVTIDGTGLSYNTDGKGYTYALSNNCGLVELKGKTSIIASTESELNNYAFDVCKYTNYDAPTVTWNSEGSVSGIIELSGGNFVVASNLKVTTPIRATSGVSTMTINGGIVVSPVDDGFRTGVKTKYTNTSNEVAKGVVVVNRSGELTIKGSGKIAAKNTYAAVMLTEKGESEAKDAPFAKLTVNEDVTLEGYYYGIVGNGNRHNTEITVNGGTITGTCNTEEDGNGGIYHPQEGKLTITGGIITGLDYAVEVRSGTEVTISGGLLKSTATTYECKANGSGSTTVGAALAIAQHNTKKPINVEISKGTFEGVRAVVLENPQGNNDATNVNVSISGGTYTATEYAVFNNYAGTTINISGGKFESTGANGIAVYARLGSVNITGGEFNNTSNSEATLHVGCPKAATDELQPKLTISGEKTVVMNNASGNYTYGGKPLVVNMANQLTYKAVEISGGKFYYRDPSKDDNVSGDNGNFLKSGYSASGDDANGYTVSATPSDN